MKPSKQMFLRLVLRALWGRRHRVAAALTALSVGSAMIFALGNIFVELSTRLQDELRPLGPNLLVTPENPETAPLIQAQEVRAVQQKLGGGLNVVVPFRHSVARLDRGEAVIAGVDLPALAQLYGYWPLEGDWVTVAFDERHVLVGRELALEMDLSVGERVSVRFPEASEEYHGVIAGVYESGTAHDQQLILAEAVMGKALGDPGTAHYLAARLPADRADVEQQAQELEALAPAINTQPLTNLSEGEKTVFTKTRGLMLLVVIAIFVLSALGVTVTLLVTFRERQGEFALYAALGGARASVLHLMLAEAFVLGLGGGLLGLVLGLGLSHLLMLSLFGVGSFGSPLVWALALGAALAIALVGTFLPWREVASTDPAPLLRAA